MVFGSLIAALLIGGYQQAPTDVPRDNWAHTAVDRLFCEGLLKGYPSRQQPTLALDSNAKFDYAQLLQWKVAWMREGLLVGYPEGLICRGRNDPSRYEIAVYVYATWANSVGMLEERQGRIPSRATILGQFENYADAISMVNPELIKLGADTKMMIAKLNQIRSREPSLFAGDRR